MKHTPGKGNSFCSKIKVDPLHPDITQALDFQTELFHFGISYSALNTALSALSALCSTYHHSTVGAHPLFIQFMKGAFQPSFVCLYRQSCLGR